LEAIVALPLNSFYNTGIATYVWVLTNRKPESRRGKVQLIDATGWYRPLRRNLGKKNCELSPEDIGRIRDVYLAFAETEESKIFPNEAFGYWKVTVERPLRLRVDLDERTRARFRAACREKGDETLADLVDRVAERVGAGPHLEWDSFMEAMGTASMNGNKLTAGRKKALMGELAVRDEAAAPVVRRKARAKGDVSDEEWLLGQFATKSEGQGWVVEYEPDPELRDTEQIPFLEPGGIAGFIEREVRPYAPDAWVDEGKTAVGYEISFTRYFYKPTPMRTLEEIRADIEALERETEGLLGEVLMGTALTP
jgi:type I restriction enzyme M protein